MRVLIVEDEVDIAELIAVNLRHAGFTTDFAVNTTQAAAKIAQALPDLLILDWMLPNESGLAYAKVLRSQERTRELPILMLTARAEEDDKVDGLEAGADDYLTKPFSPKELVARIKAVLRRRAPELADNQISLGGLNLDSATYKVTALQGDESTTIKLGPTEFRLLRFLMSHPDKVHSRTRLLDKVWGDHVFVEERTVDVHIKRLRGTLAEFGYDQYIHTVRGVGYTFRVETLKDF